MFVPLRSVSGLTAGATRRHTHSANPGGPEQREYTRVRPERTLPAAGRHRFGELRHADRALVHGSMGFRFLGEHSMVDLHAATGQRSSRSRSPRCACAVRSAFAVAGLRVRGLRRATARGNDPTHENSSSGARFRSAVSLGAPGFWGVEARHASAPATSHTTGPNRLARLCPLEVVIVLWTVPTAAPHEPSVDERTHHCVVGM